MNVSALNPVPKDRVSFSYSSLREVPKASGCYVLTTFRGFILYVGLSLDLSERFEFHVNDPGKTSPTQEGKATWFYYLRYDAKNLPRLERTWIVAFERQHGRKPILNKVSSPIG